MFNWNEIEELARGRQDWLHATLTDQERHLQEFLAERAASRPHLRSRVATALVRLGAHLDPHSVVLHQSEEAQFEGRLAAYLR